MARLKKHGKELLRIEQEAIITNPERSTIWERVTRTYHADGKILVKHDVRWKPDTYHPAGELYSYGWKVWGNVKKGVDIPAAYAKIEKAIRDKGELSKWKILAGGSTPVIISQEDLMQAVEGDDYQGFCQECGYQQEGCEPDARGYKCEECGAYAVCGAQELLMMSV